MIFTGLSRRAVWYVCLCLFFAGCCIMGSQRFHADIEMYSLLGMDTFPLIPGTKKPAVKSWQTRSPNRLWHHAPTDSNIAVRCGGEAALAVIDCDEKNRVGTFANVTRYLAGLGHLPDEYPIVQSASGIGRHIYVEFVGALDGHFRELSPDFGAGEFRFGPGAYVTAVPSVVDGRLVKMVSGDFRQLIRLDQQDALPLLKNKQVSEKPDLLKIPRRTLALLNGQGIESYESRSHAEQAIIVGLINVGFDFEGILYLFREYKAAGKFHQLNQTKPKKAMHYLQLSYENALQFVSKNEGKARRFTKRVILWAENRSWPGQTGSSDRAVFLAHADIAHRSARWEYAASARELAEIAGCSRNTATRATHRLMAANLLSLVLAATADLANVYRLNLPEQSGTLPHPQDVRKCPKLFQHDAFRHGGGLGKSAFEVYERLLSQSATARELANSTGRNIKTVARVLKRMSDELIDVATGEIMSMVQNEGDSWHALDVDLDRVAEIVGTSGTGEKQRKKHIQERARHRLSLTAGKKF